MSITNNRRYDMIYLLTAIELTPGGSSTAHIYTQIIRRKIQLTNWEECGPCPVFASYTLVFALELRKMHGKTSFTVAEE
jgi:hypothetical protein